MAIDVGPGAVAGDGDNGTNTTIVNLVNPANDTGTIRQAEFYANSAGVTGLKVGTMYGGSKLHMYTRGYATLGDFSGGAKSTVSGLSFDVSTRDYASWYASSGGLRYSNGGGTRYYVSGDQFSVEDVSMTEISGYDDSLYLTDTETAVGQPYMKRLGGVQYAAINRGVF